HPCGPPAHGHSVPPAPLPASARCRRPAEPTQPELVAGRQAVLSHARTTRRTAPPLIHPDPGQRPTRADTHQQDPPLAVTTSPTPQPNNGGSRLSGAAHDPTATADHAQLAHGARSSRP